MSYSVNGQHNILKHTILSSSSLYICSHLDNVIFQKNLNIGGKLSGIQIPDDLILSRSDSLQNFDGPLNFASDVNIYGTLSIAETLNGNSLSQMCDLLEPKPGSRQRLSIRGKNY